MMKLLTITKNHKESLLDAAKRASNQANINNKIVQFYDGIYSCLVYPNDVITNVIKAIKVIAIRIEIDNLEQKLSH